MENTKHSFTSPSKLKATILYVLLIFIGNALFAILFSMLIAGTRGLDFNQVANSFFNSDPISEELSECKLLGQGWGNFLAYFLACAGIILWMRNDFISDFNKIKENKKWYSIIIPVFAIGFAAIAFGIDMLFGLWTPGSENQTTIESLLRSDAMIPMIISTIIFAPIVEEMIYRKAIFSLAKDTSLPLAYTMSIVLFALPHMLSTASSVGMWFLQLIPYLLCGALLCVVYHLSKYNVYASIAAHMLNNLVAVISVFIRR